MNGTERTVVAPDGVSLRVRTWAPRAPPRFVVAIVHGGSEHIGRYDRLAGHFVESGALVFGADHRGQGRSGGRRGDIDDFSTYASDLHHLLVSLSNELPSSQRVDALPWFLFGHSMGGLVTLLYLADQARALPVRGAVLSSPLLELSMRVSRVKRFVVRAATRLAPTLAIAARMPPEDVCRDTQEVARYADDPDRVRVVTARWVSAMTMACVRAMQRACDLELPMLWYYGTCDRLVSTHAIERAFDTLKHRSRNDQTLLSFDGYFHELHNEPERERQVVIARVTAWMLERARVRTGVDEIRSFASGPRDV